MKRISMLCGVVLPLAASLVLFASEASAQKKKTPTKAEQATEQTTAPAAQGKIGGTVKEVLLKYKGEKTNLGVLTRVEGDYFAVEDDGVTTIHPLMTVLGIKILKLDEGDQDSPKIEISLLR